MASYTRAYQTETLGRESTGTAGPVLRPASGTLDLASDFTPPVDTAGSPDWTATAKFLPIQFKDSPLMDDRGAYTIVSNTLTVDAGCTFLDLCFQVRNIGAGAHKVQIAVVTAAGGVYFEYPEMDIVAGGNTIFSGFAHVHDSPEDTNNEFAIAVTQRTAGAAELRVDDEFIGHFRKTGNADQTFKL